MIVEDDQQHLREFQFSATVPPFVRGEDDKVIAQVARATYSRMLEVLVASGFYHQDDLSLILRDGGFELNFSDADLGFQFGMLDGRITLRRGGSRLDRFSAWYSAFMPSLGSLVDQVVDGLRTYGEWTRVDVLRAQMSFAFIAFDFKPTLEIEQTVRNAQVMNRLISAAPDDGGSLAKPDEAASALGRVDYAVSRWVEISPGSHLREIYQVEAPGNRNYSSLWLTYTVSGETYNEGDMVRQPFQFASMVGDNGEAVYERLFRAHFLDKFIPGLTEGFSFDTTAGNLP